MKFDSGMRTHLWIWIIAFAMDGAVALEMLALPLIAIMLGASVEQLGIIGALRSLTYAAVCPLSGYLSDHAGYRRMMILSCGLTAFFYALIASVSTVSLILFLAPGVGASMALFWPAFQAWFSKGQARGELLRLMGSFNIAWGLSHLVGPVAGGVLYAEDARLPFYVAIAIITLVGVFLSVKPLGVSVGVTPSNHQIYADPPHGEAYLFVAWIANFTTFFIVGVVRYIFPKMATDMGIGARSLGSLFSLIALTQTATFILTGLTDRWQYRLAPLLIAQGLVLLGMFLIGFGTSIIVLGLGFALLGLLCGISFSSGLFYSLFNQTRGGKRAGLNEAVLGCGMLLGPFLGGLAAQHFGRHAPYLLCAALLVVTACIQWYLLHNARRVRKAYV